VDWSWIDAGGVLLAHVMYGVPSRAALAGARVSLHNGDDFSLADQGPRPERLRVRALTAEGGVPLIAQGTPDAGVHVELDGIAAPAWLVVETRPAFIELAPEKFHRYLTHEGLNHVAEARAASGTGALPGREVYSKFVKTAVSAGDGAVHFLAAAAGLPIEIVPVGSTPLRLGDVLEARVLVDGLPAAEVQVRVHRRGSVADPPRDMACVRTNGDGAFALALEAAGLWRLHAIAMTAHDEPTVADWRSVWASLTFRLDPTETL